MKKLVLGIAEFRRSRLENYRQKFAHLAKGQNPDTLMIACSDSRVVPNTFASTDPGDLFVVRNVGNMVPPCGEHGMSSADESEAAAIEFSVSILGVTDIIICGHSECGAIEALSRDRTSVKQPNLRAWLRHGEDVLKLAQERPQFGAHLSTTNRLSQLNVLSQVEHLKTYPLVKERLKKGTLRLHCWWFELGRADVYFYDEISDGFVLLDENQAVAIAQRLKPLQP